MCYVVVIGMETWCHAWDKLLDDDEICDILNTDFDTVGDIHVGENSRQESVLKY